MSDIFTQHELAAGEHLRVRVGYLDLSATRGDQRWTLCWRHAPYSETPRMMLERDAAREMLGDDVHQRTFAFQQTQGPLAIMPLLADRAVIVRPSHDVTVAPQATVRLYVTTPLWAGIRVNDGELLLAELPCVQPKETWFGANTIAGERCYAGRQPLRQRITDGPVSPHRAITPLVIRNQSSMPLPIVRLRLPVPRLPLHRSNDGTYWTSRILVVHKEGSDEVDVEVVASSPDEAGSAERVAPARNQEAGNVVSRALGSVFSHSLIP